MPEPGLPPPLLALEAQGRARSAELDGLTWRVVDSGVDSSVDRRPVIMLPGALGSAKIFYRQFEFLQHDPTPRRVVLVDYPASRDVEAMARGFDRLLDLLGIDRAVLVGSSLGACWLQVFTSSGRPLASRVEHLLVGNTFVDAEALQKSPLFARSLVNERPAVDVKSVFHDFVLSLPPCELRTVQLELMREQSADDLAGRLKMVANCGTIPSSIVPHERITVLTCDDDGVTTREIADVVRNAYPGARHVAFPAGGHYPHVNRPDDYNELLGEILQQG